MIWAQFSRVHQRRLIASEMMTVHRAQPQLIQPVKALAQRRVSFAPASATSPMCVIAMLCTFVE